MKSCPDSYLHFEDLDAPGTRGFAVEARAKTRAHFLGSDKARALSDRTLMQMQDMRQIPFYQEHRARMYHSHQGARYPKGMYRVCAATTYRSSYPEWKVLFSVADFDELLGDDVYPGGVSHLVEQPSRALSALNKSGDDTAYTLEVDLEAGGLIEGGFHFPAGKNRMSWCDENSVWVYPAWDERQPTKSDCPCEMWLVERSKSFEEGLPVYQTGEGGMMVNAWRYLDPQGSPIDLIGASDGSYTRTYLQVSSEDEAKSLNLSADCDVVGYLAEHLLLTSRKDWNRASQGHPSGALVAVKLNWGELGAAQFLLTPGETQALESVEATKRFVVASLLENIQGRPRAWRFTNGKWQEAELPRLPLNALEMTDQPWSGNVVYLAASDFTTLLTLFALDLNVMELTVMRHQPQQFVSDGIEVRQSWAVPSDGERIPCFHIGKNTTPDTPTLVYAYGGLGVPKLPHYLGSIGKYWLEKGNAFVLANIRDGGEFDPRWHRAVQGTNKHKSVDDLLTVVRGLSKRDMNSPERVGLQGGSNGGLVTAATFVRRPQSVGALVCEVSLTDMIRYPLLSADASWTDEYSSPQKYGVCKHWLGELLPYHNLSDDINYPSAFVTTSPNDDHVHPAHALRFYAKLHETSTQSWLYAPDGSGHTGNGTQRESVDEFICVLLLLKELLSER